MHGNVYIDFINFHIISTLRNGSYWARKRKKAVYGKEKP